MATNDKILQVEVVGEFEMSQPFPRRLLVNQENFTRPIQAATAATDGIHSELETLLLVSQCRRKIQKDCAIGRNSTGYGCSVTKTAVVNPGTTRVPVWVLNDDWPTIGSLECR